MNSEGGLSVEVLSLGLKFVADMSFTYLVISCRGKSSDGDRWQCCVDGCVVEMALLCVGGNRPVFSSSHCCGCGRSRGRDSIGWLVACLAFVNVPAVISGMGMPISLVDVDIHIHRRLRLYVEEMEAKASRSPHIYHRGEIKTRHSLAVHGILWQLLYYSSCSLCLHVLSCLFVYGTLCWICSYTAMLCFVCLHMQAMFSFICLFTYTNARYISTVTLNSISTVLWA